MSPPRILSLVVLFSWGCVPDESELLQPTITGPPTVTIPTTTALPTDNDGDGYDVMVDCNDNNAAIYPGATEIPGDNVDQNCNGKEFCYTDADNDGARLTTTVTSFDTDCLDANEAVTGDPIDCDDTNAAIRPGAVEIAGDSVDQNCDGQEICYTDADNDGARLTTTVSSTDADCFDTFEGTSADPIDCNDANAAISPSASEVFCDGIDNDCNSSTADTIDVDFDGFTICNDCNDNDSEIYPGADETPADGLDSDCDNVELCHLDADGDGFGELELVESADLDCEDPGEASEESDTCAGYDDNIDPDEDGAPTGCDLCPNDPQDDSDGDTICDSDDRCPGENDSFDTDGDGVPNGCDECASPEDTDGDGLPDDCDACPIGDDTLDGDGDGVADACDVCPEDTRDDSDSDGVCDSDDRCPGADDSIDADIDGTPDDCDACPNDAGDDSDSDGICDSDDRCPGADDSVDADGDGIPAACDPCDAPDGACETLDSDGDGIPDSIDPEPNSAGNIALPKPPRAPELSCGCANTRSGSWWTIALLGALLSRRYRVCRAT